MSPDAQEERPLVVVVGPTASGKSGLAVELAEQLHGEVINADSMQLYRGMDIGTAKVTPEEMRGVPHHLLDVLDPTEEASVAAYQQQAREAVAAIRARGRTPILVGGSGLYVRAAIDVIDFPPTDPKIRNELSNRLAEQGPGVLREELRERDPESAAVIKDDRRLIRALEVIRLTGRTFSSFMPTRTYEESVGPVVQLGLMVPRPVLHERIAQRVARMRELGLLEEVRMLERRGLREGRTASRAIGYQQFLRVLDGALSEDQAAEETTVATRQFARRQDTWFRADPRVRWLEAPSENLAERAGEVLRRKHG
ncbi:tRNA (adenosine(37)-N6)-dimethylallyltransferase MiaA [Nesterenkonia flava]|uniref:tRNA dimethylallyltransferase n=1 Tax=Nesterenkonia flava TaxID=469799 RepID=A0ABU1FSI2_9MICC|nr:tRNA (adenosine(37)-N6)-dimethylallyltransferase MiaA [Nesterenkonia flava]MDR5711621.1 tRNA (adenosine(37)-N6)-dimethylallyltransferase MiaA [Nesterenkonia flava]